MSNNTDQPVARNTTQKSQPQAVDFTWGVRVPMRDGINLNATLYRPQDSSPTPVIFTLTPYTMDSSHLRGMFFAQHGYAFAAVDSRGRGNSQGIFEPFANEASDGHDIAVWLGKQPWCNGQVAMWGGSYAGFDQWLTLREEPAPLKTIVPTASAHAGVDFPFINNIFSPFEIQWLTYTSGLTKNTALMDDTKFWISKFQELYQHHRPFNQLDRIVGNESTFFQKWMQHPIPDDYWDGMSLSPENYDRITLPILTITGHYDDDQPGAMEYYRRHMASSSPAKDQHYLVIGPWDHFGTRSPNPEFGGIKVGPDSLLDMNVLHLEWYDWVMKAGKKPAFLKRRVAYYVMGEEKWKYAHSLQAIPITSTKFYLHSQGDAGDVFHSGFLDRRLPKTGGADTYTYDPLDTRPGELEWQEVVAPLTSQAFELNLHGNGLVYHSAPLSRELEITGWVKLSAWIELDVPDTDFIAILSEVLSDGSVIRLAQDTLRARYRESLRHEKLIVPGEINLFTFDKFTFFSRRISRGSRLRLVISSPNTIFLEKNYNRGGVVAEESGKDARIAHVRLHHGGRYPSYLELPVVR